MRRQRSEPRRDWQARVESQGLIYHTPAGVPYWNESAHYVFKRGEIDALENATAELQRICLLAAQHVIDEGRFAEFGIPQNAVDAIKQSWDEEPPSIYGRFDLAYDGSGPPKLLEYNADTPTSLLEAAVVQWYWLQDVSPRDDQWNSIHERLVEKWRELKDYFSGRSTSHTRRPTVTYGDEGYVYQALALARTDEVYPVIGAWVVDGEPAGMGIRESDTPITGNLARFVPHRLI